MARVRAISAASLDQIVQDAAAMTRLTTRFLATSLPTCLFASLLACLFAAACGDDGSPVMPDAPATVDGKPGCERLPAAADRTRFVVVSHPYDAASERSNVYEVLQLSQSGELTRFAPARTFALGRAAFGTIAFTPDAKLGFVATEDGKLAAFEIDDQGMPTVLTAGMTAAFYAGEIVVDPSGDQLWIVDTNTRENGGGIYGVSIGCDGTLTERGNVIPADFPGAFAIRPGTPKTAMIAARSVYESSPAGEDVHLVLLEGDPLGRIGGADAFGADDAIVGGAAVTYDGKHFIAGDTSPVHTNRIAIVSIEDAGVASRAIIMPFPDPQGIVASPFGDVAIATSTLDGDAIHKLDKLGPMGSWRDAGQIPYQGSSPQLPGDLVMVSRGALAGHVFVAEVGSIRHLAFRQNGAVEDLGSLPFGGGTENIVGAIGVTP